MAHRNIQSSSTWRPNWTENDRPKLFCRCDPPSPELKLRNWEHRADPSTETTETHSYTEGSWVLNSEGHWECLPRCPTYDPSECLRRPSTGSHRFWAHLQEDIQIDRHKTRNIHKETQKNYQKVEGSTGWYSWLTWRTLDKPTNVIPRSQSPPETN